MKKFIAFSAILTLLIGCGGSSDKGELVGVSDYKKLMDDIHDSSNTIYESLNLNSRPKFSPPITKLYKIKELRLHNHKK